MSAIWKCHVAKSGAHRLSSVHEAFTEANGPKKVGELTEGREKQGLRDVFTALSAELPRPSLCQAQKLQTALWWFL